MSLVPSSFAGQVRRLSRADALVAAFAPFLALELRGVDWSLEAAYALGLYCALGAAFSIIFLVQFRIGQIIPRYLSRRDVTQILKMSALAAAFAPSPPFPSGGWT